MFLWDLIEGVLGGGLEGFIITLEINTLGKSDFQDRILIMKFFTEISILEKPKIIFLQSNIFLSTSLDYLLFKRI